VKFSSLKKFIKKYFIHKLPKSYSVSHFYYDLTPVFFFIDAYFGENIRVAGLTETGPKNLYYLFVGLCMLLVHTRPKYIFQVVIIDSTINLYLMINHYFFPMLEQLLTLEEFNPSPMPELGRRQMINIAIVLAVLIFNLSGSTDGDSQEKR
jgi:hypothetical protein